MKNITTLQIPTLLYHSVSDPRLPAAVGKEMFARHMATLAALGVRAVSLREMLAEPHPHRVALTFDDGFTDLAEVAAPVLTALGFRATVYVVGEFATTGLTPWGHRALRWDELRALHRAGFEIAAHTLTHPDLTTLPPQAAQREIAGSRERVMHEIGADVHSFAYPFGKLSPLVYDMVRDAGFETACAMRLDRSQREDHWALQRLAISKHDGVARFLTKLSLPYRAALWTRFLPLLDLISR